MCTQTLTAVYCCVHCVDGVNDPGMRGGEALAEALFGLVPFSGRLPVTTVHDTAQLPPYMVQQLSYPPGRTHRYLSSPAMFPFGFGLTSHAAAHYADLRVSPAAVPANAPGSLNITVDVTVSALPMGARIRRGRAAAWMLWEGANANGTIDTVPSVSGPASGHERRNGSCSFQADMDYDQSHTPCFSRHTAEACCSLCLATAECVAFSYHEGLPCPAPKGGAAADATVGTSAADQDSSSVGSGSRCWLKPTTAGLRHLKGCVAGLCHNHPPPPPPPPPPPILPVGRPQQDEIVQVYFGWSGQGPDTSAPAARAARESGQSSVPLHELKAFRRITLPEPTSNSNNPIQVQFNISLSSLLLMRSDGSMGLLPGTWKVWVGGTSPRTPQALLRRPTTASSLSDGHSDSEEYNGAPQAPLVASWVVTGSK
jgi:hypothetical protein